MGKFSGLLLASDMDGTLVEWGRLPERNVAAINRFMDEGGLFALATGRTRRAMEILVPYVPTNAPAVLGNGALIHDYQRNETLFRRYLDGDYLEIAAEVAEKNPEVAVEVHGDDELWVKHPNKLTDQHLELIGGDAIIIDDLNIPPKPWLKAVFVADREKLTPARELVYSRAGGGYSLVSAVEHFLEFLHRDANKGAGVARLAEILKIPKERVYVIGDGNNDMSMITRFNSFAPENSADEVKKAARIHVCSAGDGAVADAIGWLERNAV